MESISSLLDGMQILCNVDDFYSSWQSLWAENLQLPSMISECRYISRMHLSQAIMTILIALHSSGYRTFKGFYTLQVLTKEVSKFRQLHKLFWTNALVINVIMLFFLHISTVKMTRISFIDSIPITVCHRCRVSSHKVFEGLVKSGKNSVGWYFGFKPDLVINEYRELQLI